MQQTMSNVIRVDIIQGKLDRTLPVSLQFYMNQNEWDTLAHEVDKAMAPVLCIQTFIPIAMVLWFLTSAAIFAASFASSSLDSGLPIGPFVIVPVLFVLLVISIVIVQYGTSDRVQKKMNAICQRFTQQHAGTLSFHLKQETYMVYPYYYNSHGWSRSAARYYLEILIATTTTTTTTAVASVVEATPWPTERALPSAPIEAKHLSAAERLAELDEIKHLLSNQEYQDKRRSILDSV
jgi:energy-coupling factor transporter transmembrane protein EcfT